MCSPVEQGTYSRMQAIDDGFLREVGHLVDEDPFLVRHFCAFDSVCVPVALWDGRLRSKASSIVDLLYMFYQELQKAHVAWENVGTVMFRYQNWICKVRAHVEDGLQCLTITEQKQPQEESNGNL